MANDNEKKNNQPGAATNDSSQASKPTIDESDAAIEVAESDKNEGIEFVTAAEHMFEFQHGEEEEESNVELAEPDEEELKQKLMLQPQARGYFEIEMDATDEGSGIELMEEPQQQEETNEPGTNLNEASPGSTLAVGLVIFLIALVGISLFAWDRTFRRSDHPHYVYLADAYLHGRLYIKNPPAWKDDYVWFENKWWVTFPPFPAVAMLPGVAACEFLHMDSVPVIDKVLCGVPKNKVAGHPYFNDTLFTIIFAAINSLLMWLLLERFRTSGISGRTRRENVWLWLLFTFGTAALYTAVLGQVWYTALVVGATMLLLYIHFAWNAEHPFWAGLFLVLAFASRPPIAMAFPIFFYFLFYKDEERIYRPLSEIVIKLFWFGLPIVSVLGLIAWHNYVRFHSPFEFGHGYIMPDRHLRHGMFGYAWLARNLGAALVNLPRITDQFPYIKFSFHGTSILFTTPAFIYVLWPKRFGRLYKLFAITAIMIALPSLLYKSTGFGQFGYRYSSDFTPLLIAMLAIGGRPITWVFKLLIFISIFWNSFGAIVFRRWDSLFFHYDFWPETPFSRE